MQLKNYAKCLSFLFLGYGGYLNAQTEFFGTASQGGSLGSGTIFSYVAGSTTITAVKNFTGADGANPAGPLVEVGNGILFGTTLNGGANSDGVIFSFNPGTSTYTKLVDFTGANGSGPYNALTLATNGKLYGSTYTGGTSGAGVLFSLDPITNVYTVLKSFNGSSDGGGPQCTMLQASNGLLYGTTLSGGANSFGVLFSYDPVSTNYVVLHDFDATYGRSPQGNHLIQATNGLLYGVTDYGGSSSDGVLYSFNISGSIYTALVNFNGTNGSGPRGSLYQAINGKIYGTTQFGGTSSNGVVFSYDPVSTSFSVLNNFSGTNGNTPEAGFALASDGLLYATTIYGGTSNKGTVYTIDPTTGTFNSVCSFNGTTQGGAPDYIQLIAYSPAGILELNKSTREITAYPVPSNDGSFTFVLKGKGYKSIRLYDALSREVYSQDLDMYETDRNLNVSLGNGSSGFYFVKIETTDGVIEKKVMVTR
jgi:uncharacterized repeat protein (TIGR03803 family)